MLNLKFDNVYVIPLEFENLLDIIKTDDRVFALTRDSDVVSLKDSVKSVLFSNAIYLDWLSIRNLLIVGNGKSLHTLNLNTDKVQEIDIPTSYKAYEWSPLQDKFVFISTSNVVYVATLDQENNCIIEKTYDLLKQEDSPFINLGWGSKETQFHGSVGKDARKEVEEVSTNIEEDDTVNIAWDDNGEFFTVNYIKDGRRTFKTFYLETEEAVEGEYKSNLSKNLSWKPNGTLLVSDSLNDDTRKLMFFEHNGLFYFEHILPNNAPIEKLIWNKDGNMLLIWQHDECKSEISIWTQSIWEWHLKQSYIFYNKENCVNNVCWVDEKTLRIITDKFILVYVLKFQTDLSNVPAMELNSIFDYKTIAALAVINGKQLRISIFGDEIKPPPLYSYAVNFNNPVNQVIFGAKSNKMVVILNDYTIKLFCITPENAVIMNSVVLQKENFIHNSYHKFLLDDRNLHLYAIAKNNKDTFLLKFNLKDSGYAQVQFQGIVDLIHVPLRKDSFSVGICSNKDIKVYDILDLNNIDKADVKKEIKLTRESGDIRTRSVVYIENEHYVFSLENENLYFNDKHIIKGINSYVIACNYLFLTTENKIVIIKLNATSIQQLEIGGLNTFFSRNIPTGANLLCAVPSKSRVILYLPRGELETINPRILIIEAIERCMDHKMYSEAYSTMRTHNINVNILYDLNPNRFMENILCFVQSIANCDLIDYFLINLENVNYALTFYKNCFQDNLPEQDPSNKVEKITDAIIKAMKILDQNFYLQSIVIAYQKKGTDNGLESALKILYAAKLHEINGAIFQVTVDNILTYLMNIASFERLYETALILYNRSLVMWILSKSQKDPSDYIPFLTKLNKMEGNYRMYKINMYVKRYAVAFSYLVNCENADDKIVSLVEDKQLYPYIIKYVPSDNRYYTLLMNVYCDYLKAESRFKDAGIIYYRLGEQFFYKAFDSFCRGGDKEEAMSLLNLVKNYPGAEINKNLHELITILNSKNKYKEVSEIYDQGLNNHEDAIVTLLQGQLWKEAHYLIMKYNRLDLIKTNFEPSLKQHLNFLCDEFLTLLNNIVSDFTRLQKLRQDKIELLRKGIHSGNFEGNDVPETVLQNVDMESVVSTTYTQSTRKTKTSQSSTSTTRKQKKLDTKLLNFKMGSAYENVGLLMRLHTLIERVQNYNLTVTETYTYLILNTDLSEEAWKLYTTYSNLLVYTKSTTEKIWLPEMLKPTEPFTIETKVYRSQLDLLDLKYHFPPTLIELKIKPLVDYDNCDKK